MACRHEAWWEEEHASYRFVSDLIAAEFASMRRTGVSLPLLPWSPTLHLCEDLGADSLELMELASALAESVHMHESGIEDYLLARPTLGDWVVIMQTGLRRFSDRLTFRTSGSTGTPKSCEHALSALMQETEALAPLFAGTRRIYSAVPSHHIFGFIFTVLLPRTLGVSDQPIIDLRGGSPARLAHELQDGDLGIGHPAFWGAVARLVPRLSIGTIGVTSTAPCPDEVSQMLMRAGIGRLVQVYGSSETAGLGWRDLAGAAYQLFPHWKRSSPDGDELVRTLPDGHRIAFRVQDKLAWCDDHQFHLHGRMDDAVQVGGINVFPSRVRQLLLQHPDVRDAAVRLMHPEEGSRLKAFIVPRVHGRSHAELHAALESWTNAQLTAVERPKAFTFGEQLPANASGKATDWRL
ncbi:AMP-binding protein [Herbaspirillum sp. GCM10030257]|uniref:AMP-binding enzyme n=1 Tax=Herbaspirillum sp. GCM10030257 TaxID=3273393 RepID=UPI0036D3CC42